MLMRDLWQVVAWLLAEVGGVGADLPAAVSLADLGFAQPLSLLVMDDEGASTNMIASPVPATD